MKAMKKQLAVGTATAVGVTIAAATVLPNVFVRIVTDRKEPALIRRTRQQLTRKLCNIGAYSEIGKATQRLATAEMEQIRTTAVDGTTLVGHWRRCENAKRIIIAMHGWRSSWARDFCACADFWQENGCSVLYAEQRGQGQSGGEYLSFGILERYDVLSWANEINRRQGSKLPIYLAGISMGATAVLLAAAQPVPANVSGVMADCGFTSPEAIWQYVAQQKLHIPYRLLKPYVYKTCKKRFGCLPNEVSTTEALKKSKVPVLLIHGTEDDFVPHQMSVAAKDACASSCKLLLVPGARHGESYLKAPQQYKAHVKAFWEENDR